MIPAIDVLEAELELEKLLRGLRTNEYLFGKYHRNTLCGILYHCYAPCVGDTYELHLTVCSLCADQVVANNRREEVKRAEHRARMLNARRR